MQTWTRGEYRVSTDPELLDTPLIRSFLAESYWAAGIPQDVVDAACRGSLCFGLYRGDAQVGFARLVTDRATFAWLADVFVVESERGAGLARWLMTCVFEHPELQGLRRWMLATRDAHGVYEPFGFRALGDPARFMEITRPGMYLGRDDDA